LPVFTVVFTGLLDCPGKNPTLNITTTRSTLWHYFTEFYKVKIPHKHSGKYLVDNIPKNFTAISSL